MLMHNSWEMTGLAVTALEMSVISFADREESVSCRRGR